MADWAFYLSLMTLLYGLLVGGALAYKLHQHGKIIRLLATWQHDMLDELTKPSAASPPPAASP